MSNTSYKPSVYAAAIKKYSDEFLVDLFQRAANNKNVLCGTDPRNIESKFVLLRNEIMRRIKNKKDISG